VKLRLIVTERCDKACLECCNQNYDLTNLPVERDFRRYSQIMLTGGEPMLEYNFLIKLIAKIREQTFAPIFLYTANLLNLGNSVRVMGMVDGATVAVHDVMDFRYFMRLVHTTHVLPKMTGYPFRLKHFGNIPHLQSEGSLVDYIRGMHWDVRQSTWVEGCPLPEGEVLARARSAEWGVMERLGRVYGKKRR